MFEAHSLHAHVKAYGMLKRGVASGSVVLAAVCVQMIRVIPYSVQPIPVVFTKEEENAPRDHFPWSVFLAMLGDRYSKLCGIFPFFSFSAPCTCRSLVMYWEGCCTDSWLSRKVMTAATASFP